MRPGELCPPHCYGLYISLFFATISFAKVCVGEGLWAPPFTKVPVTGPTAYLKRSVSWALNGALVCYRSRKWCAISRY